MIALKRSGRPGKFPQIVIDKEKKILCNNSFRNRLTAITIIYYLHFVSLKYSLSPNILRKAPVLESLFNSLYLKETPTQVFSCEYCKIFKNSFFHRTTPVAASDYLLQKIVFKPFLEKSV